MKNEILNGTTIAILCLIPILFVLFQSLIFGKMAWKKGKELDIKESDMKKVIVNSSIFSILPSLPILIVYILLIPGLGKFFPWLRLSVIGSAAYENMAADMASKTLGYTSVIDPLITSSHLISILIVMTVGILGGLIFNILFLKSYDNKLQQLRGKNEKFMSIAVTTIMLGMFGTLSAPYIVNFKSVLPLTSMIISGITILLCYKFHDKFKIKLIKDFAFTISLLTGMISASVINYIL